MAIPKSVTTLNKAPFGLNKFAIGTKLNQLITFARELHDHFSTSGGMFSLLNELRTRLHTGGDYQALIAELRTRLHTGGDYKALIEELRTRLHTGGDYQLLVAELRTRHVANGDFFETLLDVADKAYNQLLVAPGWQQNTGGGGNTQFENTAALDVVINGVYSAALFAATQDIAVAGGTANADTLAGEFRAITLSLTAGGALTQTISAVAVAAPVTPPRPPSGEVPVGVIQIPASFTQGVTAVQTAWFTQGFPRRIAVPVVVAAAAPAAIAAANPAVIAAAAPAAIASAALTTTSTTKPEALPDRYQ